MITDSIDHNAHPKITHTNTHTRTNESSVIQQATLFGQSIWIATDIITAKEFSFYGEINLVRKTLDGDFTGL